MPTLSVLMASLTDRADLRDQLAAHIRAQMPDGRAELLIDVNDGPCWQARQRLLEAASGGWVCFVDDDDWVADDYIPALLAAIDDGQPDYVGFVVRYTVDGREMPSAYHNAAYSGWWQDGQGYYRDFSHLNPIRRDLALKAGFSGGDRTEDAGYADRLRTVGVTSHVFVDRDLYHYRFRTGPKWWAA